MPKSVRRTPRRFIMPTVWVETSSKSEEGPSNPPPDLKQRVPSRAAAIAYGALAKGGDEVPSASDQINDPDAEDRVLLCIRYAIEIQR